MEPYGKLVLPRLTGQEREAREAAIVKLENQLAAMHGDLASLHAAQAALLGRVNECCKNDSALALLVKKAVQDEIAVSSFSLLLEEKERKSRQRFLIG